MSDLIGRSARIRMPDSLPNGPSAVLKDVVCGHWDCEQSVSTQHAYSMAVFGDEE